MAADRPTRQQTYRERLCDYCLSPYEAARQRRPGFCSPRCRKAARRERATYDDPAEFDLFLKDRGARYALG